jgi:hypothetical protein
MPRPLLLLILAAIASSSALAAEVYKWTDAAGVVHYSDTKPPDDAKAQLLTLTSTTTTESDAVAAEPEPEPEEKPADGALAGSPQRAELRCEQARSNLELLQSKYTVGLDTGAGGQAQVLDDAQRQRQIASAQTLIATYCK